MVEDREKVFDFLDRARRMGDMTVRDDQAEFPVLLDGARVSRRRRRRFRLVDTGKLSLFELEWLGEAGVDLYTSDDVRSNVDEVDWLIKACTRGKAIVAYFHHGQRNRTPASQAGHSLAAELGRRGAYLHVSGREEGPGWEELAEIASTCLGAGAWLVYYHHGPFEENLGWLVRAGAWLHLSDKSLASARDVGSLIEAVAENPRRKPRVVVHVEQGLAPRQARDLEEAGVFLLFKTAPSDYRSPLYAIEKRANRERLDFRAYYLYPTFLP